MPFIIPTKNILRINLTEDMQDLYGEKFVMFFKQLFSIDQSTLPSHGLLPIKNQGTMLKYIHTCLLTHTM